MILPAPRCPKCRSGKVRVDGTIRRGDTDTLRYLECQEKGCGERFVVTFTTDWERLQIFHVAEKDFCEPAK